MKCLALLVNVCQYLQDAMASKIAEMALMKDDAEILVIKSYQHRVYEPMRHRGYGAYLDPMRQRS